MINSILIIGLGNIGERHFESVCNINKKLEIYLVDPNIFNSKKKLIKVNKYNHKLIFSKNIKNFKINFDFVIISTNSDIRKKILFETLKKNQLKKVILEKVTFTNINDYNQVIRKIEKDNIDCFINYPRNFLVSYRNLKRKISNKHPIKCKISGSNWGLASNSFHFISLFSYLTNFKDIFINNCNLSRPFRSKREGYYEFNGRLEIMTKNKDILILEDLRNYSEYVTISIENNKNFFLIFEKFKKIINLNFDNNIKITNKHFNFLLQSEITKGYLNSRNIDKLESININKLFRNEKILLKVFLKEFNRYKKFKNKCPIT